MREAIEMVMSSKNKFLTPSQAWDRIRKYCGYQERSHEEVRYKLVEVGIRGNDLENIMTRLIEEGFLNEERYAIAYAGGKFRMQHWGRNKIQAALKQKGVSDYCIRKGLAQIDDSDYRKSLLNLLKKKAASVKNQNVPSQKQKLVTFLVGKGYEPHLVWEIVNEYYDANRS